MLALEKKGFTVRDLQNFVNRFCEKVDVSRRWLDHQVCRYEYDPMTLGSTFRLQGMDADGKMVKAPLVFSLWCEVPYTLNANCWEPYNFESADAEQELEKSINTNSSDKLDPWLLS